MRRSNRTVLRARSSRVRQAWTCFALMLSLSSSLHETPAWAQGKVIDKTKDDMVINPDKLPANFQPPPPRLEIMDLEMPIATKDELEKLKKDSLGKWSKTRIDADLSGAGRKVIEDSVRHRLASMTLKDSISTLPQQHKRFVEEIANVGGPAIRPAAMSAMIDFIGQEVVRQSTPLLKNNFFVRLHVVMILGEMDFAPAYVPLLQVISAPDIHDDPVNGQPEAIKIAATAGLIRILTFAKPPPTVPNRTTIARAVEAELAKPKLHWWLQVRMLEVLRNCDITGVDAGSNKPFVVDILISVIQDEQRSWIVRAKACYVLGRVPLPPTVKPADVVTVVSDFALQISNAAAAKPNNPAWKGCFWDLYLTFKFNNPSKGQDQDAEKKIPGGLLARIKTEAQPAYDLIVPIVTDVLHEKAPAAGNRQALDTFVKARPAVKPAK